MIEIICTLIVCSAAVAIYWLYLNGQKGSVDNTDAADGFPYRESQPLWSQSTVIVEAPAKPSGVKPKVIPKLAQEYLDAEQVLLKKAQSFDMKGMSTFGDGFRGEAANCREKAEQLIREANFVSSIKESNV